MQNAGKRFEEDFKKSAEKDFFVYRLRDPAASFEKSKNLRFSWRNICDFVMFKYPNLFLIECKSHKGLSIPFSAIKSKDKDRRLRDMARSEKDNTGLFAYVVFNWREKNNKTVAVKAAFVHKFISSEGAVFDMKPRKSIPFAWTQEWGVEIDHRLLKTRYRYDVSGLAE